MLSTTASARILVFDSGVGGLSIASEIQSQLPNCSIAYCSDNAAFPYGTKGEQELVKRLDCVLHAVIKEDPIDIIVVACNSASTLALPHIRSHFSQPTVGVVPAIKPAAAISNTKVIGLLATPGTVSREYTQRLIADFAHDCEVEMVGSADLVQLAEQKLRGDKIEQQQLTPILEKFSNPEMDTVILACTHFPLLREEIQLWFGDKVRLVDSADAIARRVAYLINNHSMDHIKQEDTPANRSYFTQDCTEVRKLEAMLAQYSLNDMHFINA